MAAYSSIDRETFAWVKAEVEATLGESRAELERYQASLEGEGENASPNQEPLYAIVTQLHQVVGSLQMLELKSLSSLMMESELLVEDHLKPESVVRATPMAVLLESSIKTLRDSLHRIDQGRPENPIEIVELINQIRAVRGLDAVEISSLFSPDIDVFPELSAQTPLLDDDFKNRAKALRRHFQSHLLHWLRDNDSKALESLGTVAEKLLAMSTFGAVARLWWVAIAYIDYVQSNELKNRAVHGRIFRGVDDLLRKLERQGESALVRDPGEEVIKIMLFYTGVGSVRTPHMDAIAGAFSLHHYFPDLDGFAATHDYSEIQSQIDALATAAELRIPEVRTQISEHFEKDASDSSVLADLVKQMQTLGSAFAEADIEIASPLVSEALDIVKNLRNGSVASNDDNGFHLAAAIIFIENSLNGTDLVDEHWVQNGQLKIRALQAINNQEAVTSEMDGSHITGSERKALLDVVGSEVEESLHEIEGRLEKFSEDLSNVELLEGIAPQIRHVRGALQVLGEQKVGLLLQLSEDQFIALQTKQAEATPALVDALATSIGTMEEYVIGLQRGRKDMDGMLDRSITDLEMAVGKKVSRADVEDLLDQSSDSLFSWLGEQSDFALFTELKANLRDLRTLAKKTGLSNVDELVKEQNRLIDVISQEPAFLTGNITSSLQNNMASITAELIQLYGTEDTPEELAAEKKSSSSTHGADAGVTIDEPRIYDDMDLQESDEKFDESSSDEDLSATERGKQHAAIHQEDLEEDPIFAVFVEESPEVLAEAKRLHAACNENPNDRGSIRDLRRAFHTLKGSSRMVGLNEVGEIAWFSESLFNYVLDTEKPLTNSILAFSADAIEEFQAQLDNGYKEQHLIDTAAWGEKTEQVRLDETESVQANTKSESIEQEKLEATEKDSPLAESLAEAEADSENLLEQDSELKLGDGLTLEEGDAEDDVALEDPLEGLDIEFEDIEIVGDEIEPSSEGSLLAEGSQSVSETESADDEDVAEGETAAEGDDNSEQTVSYLVIDDQEMRDVFIKEATQHLGTISECLAQESLKVEPDDDFSIAIHTMLGNARTLDLKPFSRAFDLAEGICSRRQEGDQPLTDMEQASLAGLLSLSFTAVSNAQDEPPYFPIDEDEWDAVENRLKAALNEPSTAHEVEESELLEGDEFDEVIELSSGFEFLEDQDDDDIEIDMLGDDESAARVASIFAGLDSIDDLSEPGNPEISVPAVDAADELAAFESSLDSFKGESVAESEAENDAESGDKDDQKDDDKNAAKAEELNEPSSSTTRSDQAERESLLPDDLTNLIEDDLLNIGAAVQGLDQADGEPSIEDVDDAELDIDQESATSDDSRREPSADTDHPAVELGDSEAATPEEDSSEQDVSAADTTEEQADAEADPLESDSESEVVDQADEPEISAEAIETEAQAETETKKNATQADDSPELESLETPWVEPLIELESSSETNDRAADEDERIVLLDEYQPISDIEETPLTSAIPDGDAVSQYEVSANEVSAESTVEQTPLETSEERSEELADNAKSVEGADIDEELREIFVNELRNIQQDLDSEVAKLAEMQATPAAMANIMRFLHTVKGSSLMAEANTLGELTHQTESYLEGNFIRNADDLRQVRTTLELYVDALDTASDSYESRRKLQLSSELLERIGGLDDVSVPAVTAVPEVEVEPEVDDAALTNFDISQALTVSANSGAKIFSSWKSARGWKKTKPALLSEYQVLDSLAEEAEQLSPLADFITKTKHYISELEIKSSSEFKASKGLLEELFDAAIANANSLVSGQGMEDLSALHAQLTQSDTANALASPVSTAPTVPAAELPEVSKEAIFVPGAVQVDELQVQDQNRQRKAARERAAALRIQTETLDSLTNFVGDASMNRSQMREDVLSVKNTVEGLYDNVRRFTQQLRELEIEADSKISSRSNEALAKDRGEEFDPLELDRYTKLQQLSRGLTENLDELNDIQTSLSNFVYRAETSLQKQDRLNRELQDEIMQVRLVSFGGIGPQLRQVVRRTSRELDKDVELEIIGADVRLDKAILDGIVPALEHMLRNAVDHGIESPSERSKTKKPKTGKITVECRQVAREIVLSIRDDGVGLDLEKIRAQAVEEKMLAADQALNPADMLMYISQSGFSTAAKLTQISGRGVGMDVVQTTLRRMSGSISYDLENTQPGSSFTVRLPISLAVTSAMFVHAGGKQFAVSARTIERVINVQSSELSEALNDDKPVIDIAGYDYTLIDLADYLGYDSIVAGFNGKMAVILVNAGVQNIAVIVDELLDTQEIVVKNLGGHLGRIPIYAGATIRADGNVVLLVDLVGISYYESFISLPELSDSVAQNVANVMVVDDSLTVRKSAERDITGLGINAILAKDGLDAQEQLADFKPDMILLDIEMPRMDGFELLEWVRADENLRSVPVVMISSRATEKHINKATELGCNAFLGKPYLLENLVTMFNQYLPLDAPIKLEK